MTGVAVASALARPTIRHLLVLAGLAGAWAAFGQGLATRVAGALGGWLTAVGGAIDVALVIVAVSAAVSGSSWRALGTDAAWHLAGVDLTTRRLVVAATGALVGITVLVSFGLGAALTGWVRAVADGTAWWVTEGFAVPSVGGLASLATRLIGAAGILGALAALAGRSAPGATVAAIGALVATMPFVPVAGGIVSRAEGVLSVASYTPVGAVRAVALGVQGLAVPGLEQRADVWPHAAVLVGWVLVLTLTEPVVATRRHRPTTSRPRPGPSSSSPPRRATRAWTLVGVTVAVTATFTAAVALPPVVNDALPWRWQPAWRSATRTGRASDQVVARAVAAVRYGDDPGAPVPAPVAEALRRARAVAVAPPSQLREPGEVWVRVALAEPVVTGDHELRAVAVRFVLEPDGHGGWAITGADGPVAAAGNRRPDGGGGDR